MVVPVSSILTEVTKAVIAFQATVFAFACEHDEQSFNSGTILDFYFGRAAARAHSTLQLAGLQQHHKGFFSNSYRLFGLTAT
jgi:hypothetical protein